MKLHSLTYALRKNAYALAAFGSFVEAHDGVIAIHAKCIKCLIGRIAIRLTTVLDTRVVYIAAVIRFVNGQSTLRDI